MHHKQTTSFPKREGLDAGTRAISGIQTPVKLLEFQNLPNRVPRSNSSAARACEFRPWQL